MAVIVIEPLLAASNRPIAERHRRRTRLDHVARRDAASQSSSAA
jgi:hypothetical protein